MKPSLTFDSLPVQVLALGEIAYSSFLKLQESLLQKAIATPQDDLLLLASHEPVYTAGVQLKSLPKKINGIPVYKAKRGGKLTYHGHGMLMTYFLFNLHRRRMNIYAFIENLLRCAEIAFATFGLSTHLNMQHPGLWINSRKIVSVGFAVSHSITSHGLAFHLQPDLSPFQEIDPCGLSPSQITSFQKETGYQIPLPEFSRIFLQTLSHKLQDDRLK